MVNDIKMMTMAKQVYSDKIRGKMLNVCHHAQQIMKAATVCSGWISENKQWGRNSKAQSDK